MTQIILNIMIKCMTYTNIICVFKSYLFQFLYFYSINGYVSNSFINTKYDIKFNVDRKVSSPK